MRWASPFDEAVAAHGPPAVFVHDPEGQWRLAPDLTRDAWTRLGAAAAPLREPPAFALVRDRATGYVSLWMTTAPALLADHPRLEVRFHADEASARAARRAIGPPYVARRPLSGDAGQG